MFETIGKLYLYLAMIADSYHIPVIANNIVIYYTEFFMYIFKLKGFVFRLFNCNTITNIATLTPSLNLLNDS